MKTHLLIEIDHSKPLPDDLTDDAANRVYTMLHARGIACDVTVKIDAHKEINGGWISIPKERLALNVQHNDCHKAADAFWAYWKEYGETHKRGYYESTWGAINRALRTVGVVEHEYMKAAADAIELARRGGPMV